MNSYRPAGPRWLFALGMLLLGGGLVWFSASSRRYTEIFQQEARKFILDQDEEQRLARDGMYISAFPVALGAACVALALFPSGRQENKA